MHHYTLTALALAAQAAADCACGYTVNATADPDHAIFTGMLESDFLHTYDFQDETAKSMGWLPQNYIQPNTSGPYGMAKMLSNVVANPLRSIWDWGGEGIDGGDPGLQLWVKTDVVGRGEMAYVPSAEIVSARDDILYGSFRIAMKTTSVHGTCAAFFFYRNDTQEIDIEILSAQQFAADTQWPVNLVVQNTTAQLALNDSSLQSSNMVYHMVRQPDGPVGSQYREYRFDWLPDRIDYYVDGWHAFSFTDGVPSSPGAIHFSHWSNGNSGWSHGPPRQDAVMTVAYVKAYFNTTSAAPVSNQDCSSTQWRGAGEGLCQIPDQYSPPWPGGPKGNETGWSHFFSRQQDIERNATDTNDVVHGDLIHTPDEDGSGTSISQMRARAFHTLFALSIAVAAVRLLRCLV